MKLTHLPLLLIPLPTTVLATWHLSLIHKTHTTQTAHGLDAYPCTPIHFPISPLLHLSFTGLEYSISITRPQLLDLPPRPKILLNGKPLARHVNGGELVARVSKKAVVRFWSDAVCGREGGVLVWEGDKAWMAMGLGRREAEVAFGEGTEMGMEMLVGSFEVVMLDGAVRNVDGVVVEVGGE